MQYFCMKIFVAEADNEVDNECKRFFGETNGISLTEESLTEENASLAKDADILSVFIYSKLTEGALNKMPKLKFISTRSTGYDHVDLRAAQKKGIITSNVVGYGTLPVPEHTFALLLSLSRKIKMADRRVREGNFDYHGLMGTQIYGKTFGVLGTGAIGTRVAELALAFGANVLAYDVVVNRVLVDKGIKYVTLEDALKESDFVSLNLPLLPSTRGLLSESKLALMKKSAYLVNTGRGGVLDENALVKMLKEGRIAGAALDVFAEEPPRGELLQLDNVLLSPHIGWYTDAGFSEIMKQTFENINAFMGGKPIRVVKP